MNKNIINRVINEGKYIINTNKTIREIADVFNVSKSTVHKDLSILLLSIDIDMYKTVQNILKHHIEIRHINGGEATKQKYLLNSK